MLPQRKERQDDDADESPYAGLQTTHVLKEASIFNERQLDSAKCSRALTRILYILNQGEEFTQEETTNLFFSVTKLFQSQDIYLRSLVYLVIKVLKIPAHEALIVVNCLNKDMTGKIDIFRAKAIRVLAKIVEPQMVGQIERFLKQALVDQNPYLVGSTLVAGQHLYLNNADVVRRWVTEVQAGLSSKSYVVQYQALALLYQIKRHDRLAISKVLVGLARNPPRGPMFLVLMIRAVASVLQQTKDLDPELLKFLTECLRNKGAMVEHEAARTLCTLPNATYQQILPAIATLHTLLAHSLSVIRFGAVRTVAEVVDRFPVIVSSCSTVLEHLLVDTNRSIATLAITTLLKTATEATVDRLLKSVSGFMSDIPDEFKITLVESLKSLCLRFRHKHCLLMGSLATNLREEGGFAFKQSIVNAMIEIIENIPESREIGLEHFCEFIEDSEFPELTIKILHLLAQEGHRTNRPATYIRFIYNRIILETPHVRAAAVTALAHFATNVPSLMDHCVVLLKRCFNDNNDDVRDRAAFYVNAMTTCREQCKELLFPGNETQLPQLRQLKEMEASLKCYLEVPHSEPFSVQAHFLTSEETKHERDEKGGMGGGVGGGVGGGSGGGSGGGGVGSGGRAEVKDNQYSELFDSIPAIKELGAVWKSSPLIELTESETEYVVTCTKHVFPQHLLFQFNVTNNLEDQLLENVTVEMESENEEWELDFTAPIARLGPKGASEVTFVCMRRPEKGYSSGPLSCVLKFSAREVDEDEGAEDEYNLEDVEVNEADYVRRGEELSLLEFRQRWEALEGKEGVKKYSLGLSSLQGAVNAVLDLLGLHACEGSNIVPDGVRSHTVNLAGTFFGGTPVLARAGFLLDAKPSVTLKIAVRSQDEAINKLISHAIH